jgi:hypothetical protein
MRSLLIAVAGASQLFGNCEGKTVDDLRFAPSKPDPDEQVATDHSGFDKCEAAMALLTDRPGTRIANRTYTISKRWGKVLRARAITIDEGASVAPVVVCWTGSGPGAHIFLDYSVPDLNQPPATTK